VSRTRIDPSPTPADDSDQLLIALAKGGDAQAYGRLVQRYQGLVVRTARALGAGEVAEDAAQDAFVAAWEALDRFDDERPFRPWILAIVTNGVRNRQRAWRRRPLVLQPYSEADQSLAPAGDDLAMVRETRRLLVAAIERLPERQQLVVAYRYLLQLSEAETATALGWPVGTVKSRLSRALDRLGQDPTLTNLLDAS
jgi:RNA polymerase sigma-70 factor (ECF subfamily)